MLYFIFSKFCSLKKICCRTDHRDRVCVCVCVCVVSVVRCVCIMILLQIFLISFTIDTISVAHRLLAVHQGLVLCPDCVPEKVDVNQKGVNQNQYSHKKTKT